jgi:hypothetical protein
MKREQEANPKLEPLEKGSDLCLDIEELEPIVVPQIAANSNETMIVDNDLESEVEELEPIIAPGIKLSNSNETLVADPEED